MQNDEQKQRIKLWMGACLVLVAFSADLLEFILDWVGIGLVINAVMSPGYTFLFWLWFKLLDVPFIASPKKFLVLAVTSLAEIIPGLDGVGGFLWTLGTLLIVIMTRLEDRGGALGAIAGASTRIMSRNYKTHKDVFDDPAKLKINKSNLAIKKKDLLAEAATGGRSAGRYTKEELEKGTADFKEHVDKNVINRIPKNARG